MEFPDASFVLAQYDTCPTHSATHQVARPPGGHFPHGLGVHSKAPGLKEDRENPRQQAEAVHL